MKRKIYLASSWKTDIAPTLAALRDAGHEIYDFKNPRPDDDGFRWTSIDPNWKTWTPAQLAVALQHPIAVKGHGFDHEAMEWADAGVIQLPAGSSAHLEAGFLAGRYKPTCVYAPTTMREAELMYRSLAPVLGENVIFTHIAEVIAFLDAQPAYLGVNPNALLCAHCYRNGRDISGFHERCPSCGGGSNRALTTGLRT